MDKLKDQLFNKEKVQYLAGLIKEVYIVFDDKNFKKDVLKKFPELELKQRIYHITGMLKKYLPGDFEKALEVLLLSLPDEVITEIEDNNFGDFIFCPYGQFVATYGCNEKYLSISLDALEDMTIKFSAEDAIRYFINEFEEETFKKILEWSKSKNYHHRRLASEGTRPKLPWSKKINLSYKKTIYILDNLYYDNSRFVTRSVANHLNDISKIDSGLVISTLERWQKSEKQNTREMDYIIFHSTRTLIKAGNKQTLEFLGYSVNPQIEVKNFVIKNDEIKIGESLEFDFDIYIEKNQNLIIDYKIYFVLKNGRLGEKVFKIKKINLKKSENISKKHPLRIMTTKILYPGKHFVDIIINGKSFGKKEFILKK